MRLMMGLFLVLFYLHGAFASDPEIKIGILALRGQENTHKKWNATAAFLSEKIKGYNFIIVPLDFSEIDPAIARSEVDFLLANSSIYVNMEHKYRISRIATLKRKTPHAESVSFFGGVIFTKSDRKDINSINDLKGKTFAAVDETSLGGWHMAWRKMLQKHFDPHAKLKKLMFSGTHDQVVYDVLAKKVDAGTVRTGVLESMANEHKISLDDIKVIAPQQCEKLNILNSTECYPEWPIAKLNHTNDLLASKVAIALISLAEDDPINQKASIHGWSIPHNYTSVHNLRKELKLPPYDKKIEITFAEVLDKYGFAIFLLLFILLISITATISILRLNLKLQKSKKTLRDQFNKLKEMQEQLVESEKMASLGGLVAGVSHEINTPVGLALTGITHLLDEQKHLLKKYEAEEMSEEDFTEFLSLNKELGSSIEINLRRAANLVHSFKRVAVDQSSEEIREFEVKAYVEEILTSLHNHIKNTKHHITLDIDPKLRVYNYPGAFSQIITNLILNSILHAYDKNDEGHITIFVKREGKGILLIYKDDGKGIPKENLTKIFDPFFTTNRENGGSGLGMNIVYNIVVQQIKGKINVTSKVGKGVEFEIILPCMTKS
jgi:phosphate/phosphite/phosphonate ABC transporter binding protein